MQKKCQMNRKKVIISYSNITPDILHAIQEKYPDGWANFVIKVNKSNNDFFHAITVDLGDTSYLVKVNVKVDSVNSLKDFEKEHVEADHSHDEAHDHDEDSDHEKESGQTEDSYAASADNDTDEEDK